jgi:hypothetical protein
MKASANTGKDPIFILPSALKVTWIMDRGSVDIGMMTYPRESIHPKMAEAAG